MSIDTNLVGSPLDSGVINQISARASLHKQSGFSDDNSVIFRSKKNAWLKLSSFVEITDTDLAKALGGTGTSVARKWCLFNGLHQTNGVDRKPLGMEGYGIGGIQELGFRPMPGLTSATIEYAGTAGSIQIATVRAKVWTMEQLTYIDALYLRLGFSVLLEWGHGMYADNLGNIKISESPIDIFGNNYSKEGILKELASKRKSSFGNYDGMLGLVTNYNWTQTNDGGYDITISLTGIGSIIESLKINGTETSPVVNFSGGNASSVQTATRKVTSSIESFLTLLKSQATLNKSQADFKQYVGYAMKNGLNYLRSPSDQFTKGFNADYMVTDNKNIPNVDFDQLCRYAKVNFQTGDNTKTDYVYIPLGLLLAYISNSCVFYDKRTSTVRPIVYIDFNPETNFCFRLPQQFSIDPRVCLVDLACKDDEFNELFSVRNINPATIQNKFVQNINDLTFNIYNSQGTSQYKDNAVAAGTRGKIMNIMVNIDKIFEILQSQRDTETSNVYLSLFVETLLKDINRSLGSVNKFRIGYVDEANTIRIYDDQLVDSAAGPAAANLPTLPVFGLSSVVRDFSLKTETSTRIGSLLAITAMAGERRPVAGNRDGSAFSALNSRLRDRLMPLRESTSINGGSSTTSTGSDNVQALTEQAQLFNNHVTNMFGLFKFNVDDIEKCIQYYPETMNTLKTEIAVKNGAPVVEATDVSARGILPLALNVTLDGLSGIKLYQAFKLPIDRLPAQYKEGSKTRIGFTIAGISHAIDNQQWVTSIRAMMINIPAQKGRTSGGFGSGLGGRPGGAGGGGGGGGAQPQATPIGLSQLGFIIPVSKPFIINSFQYRSKTKEYGKLMPKVDDDHHGIDIVGPNAGRRDDTLSRQVGGYGTTGDFVYAVYDGTVRVAGAVNGFGYAVYLSHKIGNDSYETVYGHMPLGGIFVKVGDTVKKGDKIAYIGNEFPHKGFHLHFEIWKGLQHRGKLLDPMDELPFFTLNGGNIPGNIAQKNVKYS
jgi:hypothetical protein